MEPNFGLEFNGAFGAESAVSKTASYSQDTPGERLQVIMHGCQVHSARGPELQNGHKAILFAHCPIHLEDAFYLPHAGQRVSWQ